MYLPGLPRVSPFTILAMSRSFLELPGPLDGLLAPRPSVAAQPFRIYRGNDRPPRIQGLPHFLKVKAELPANRVTWDALRPGEFIDPIQAEREGRRDFLGCGPLRLGWPSGRRGSDSRQARCQSGHEGRQLGDDRGDFFERNTREVSG